MPPNWECKLDGTEWVCISKYEKQAKEAIIILTAKEVGPTDTLTTYTSHLKSPRSLPDKTGKVTPSKVLHVKERLIAGHPWIDGMHLGSEIASYYTRYLATVKDRLAILVTFSAHKDHYTKYSSDFLKAIESIRVVAPKDILDSNPQIPMQGNNERQGLPIRLPEIDPSAMPPEPKGNDLKTKLSALALLIGAIGFYLWRRKKS
ncbi:MAG: hypothetical protein KDD38_11585 [Bdellovibrionales bacterium]|nr:hypothetical protein [Bdellovibrionales bacterium]